MAQRISLRHDEYLSEESTAFLQRRGIVPANGRFTSEQLAHELTRRGWRWQAAQGRVRVTRAYTPSGTKAQSFESAEPDQVVALASLLIDAIRFDEERGIGFARPIRADVVIRAPDQHVIAIIEAKALQGLSNRLAAEFRGNLISSSSGYALAPFFLLVTQDAGFLWDQRVSVPPHSLATRRFSTIPVIVRYLPWLGPGERPGGNELALAVASWLDDLANPIPHRPAPAEEAFAGTAFLDAIKGAMIATDAPA